MSGWYWLLWALLTLTNVVLLVGSLWNLGRTDALIRQFRGEA